MANVAVQAAHPEQGSIHEQIAADESDSARKVVVRWHHADLPASRLPRTCLRGRLGWRREVFPLVPWFVAAAAAGLLTAWIERRLIGAEGGGFDLSIAQRFLLAGRVIWFYLGRLGWPSGLMFIYPRWEIHSQDLLPWFYPVAALLFMALLGYGRKWWGKLPFAGLLFFMITLSPMLGLTSFYFMRFSFVADHFQQLRTKTFGIGKVSLAARGMNARAMAAWC